MLIKWSEVWPLAVALTILFFFTQKGEHTSIIIWLIIITLIFHTAATIISLYTYKIPEQFKNNNILYNLIAFIKPLLVGLYILKLKQLKTLTYLRIVYVVFILFTIVNFTFLENIFTYSTHMVIAESIVLLIFTMTFFLNSMIDDEIPLPLNHPAYFLCTATGIFESINFFIYLFIFPVFYTNQDFADLLMNISGVAFIIYGLILAAGLFYNRHEFRFKKAVLQNE